MRFGRTNAQFLTVSLGLLGLFGSAIWSVGGLVHEVRQQREIYDTKTAAVDDRIAAARAEAIQQCNEKFLTYGYAAEYKKLREKTLGHSVSRDID